MQYTDHKNSALTIAGKTGKAKGDGDEQEFRQPSKVGHLRRFVVLEAV